MNPLSILHVQNKTYDPKIMIQAQFLFDKISRAILDDQNFIEYNETIYPINRLILMTKGYFVENGKIIWNDYL
jgi:hypothetical protein